MANEQEPNYAPNILEYHGANVAFLDAQYRGRLLKLPDVVLEQIKPYPPKTVNVFMVPEEKQPQQTTIQKEEITIAKTDSSSGAKETQPSTLSKLITPIVVGTSLLTGAGIGAAVNESVKPDVPVVQPIDDKPIDKIKSEVGIEVH